MSFSSHSAFNQTDLSSLSDELREQIFFPRVATKTEVVFVALPRTRIQEWETELDDALFEIEDGSAAGLERAVRYLEQLRKTITAELQKNATAS